VSLASESARVSPFSRELESNTGCEQGLVENASATAKSAVCERCDGPHASSACPHFKEQRDDHPDAQRRKCLALGSDGPQTHSVASSSSSSSSSSRERERHARLWQTRASLSLRSLILGVLRAQKHTRDFRSSLASSVTRESAVSLSLSLRVL